MTDLQNPGVDLCILKLRLEARSPRYRIVMQGSDLDFGQNGMVEGSKCINVEQALPKAVIDQLFVVLNLGHSMSRKSRLSSCGPDFFFSGSGSVES